MFMSGTNCTVSSITHSNDDSIVPLILVRECRNWLPVLDFGGSRYVSEHISTNIWAVPHSLFATPLVHAQPSCLRAFCSLRRPSLQPISRSTQPCRLLHHNEASVQSAGVPSTFITTASITVVTDVVYGARRSSLLI
jgi:hypothetical protein